MKSNIKLIARLITALLLSTVIGCASSVHDVSQPDYLDREKTNPFSYGDEFSSSQSSDDFMVSPHPEDNNLFNDSLEESGSGVENGLYGDNSHSSDIFGYRIQIGLFENHDEAQQMVEYARSKLDVNVYLVYEPPFYRVRVGDFTTREDADSYLTLLKDLDRRFRDSYWLRMKINTP